MIITKFYEIKLLKLDIYALTKVVHYPYKKEEEDGYFADFFLAYCLNYFRETPLSKKEQSSIDYFSIPIYWGPDLLHSLPRKRGIKKWKLLSEYETPKLSSKEIIFRTSFINPQYEKDCGIVNVLNMRSQKNRAIPYEDGINLPLYRHQDSDLELEKLSYIWIKRNGLNPRDFYSKTFIRTGLGRYLCFVYVFGDDHWMVKEMLEDEKNPNWKEEEDVA